MDEFSFYIKFFQDKRLVKITTFLEWIIFPFIFTCGGGRGDFVWELACKLKKQQPHTPTHAHRSHTPTHTHTHSPPPHINTHPHTHSPPTHINTHTNDHIIK